MDKPKCRKCHYAKTFLRSPAYWRSGEVYCEHPDQDCIHEFCHKRKVLSDPGFICRAKYNFVSGKHEIIIRTHPRWCPLAKAENSKTEE